MRDGLWQHTCCELFVRSGRADHEEPRGIDAMPVGEVEQEPGQWRTAPAHRGARGMRAGGGLHRKPASRAEERILAFRQPGEDEPRARFSSQEDRWPRRRERFQRHGDPCAFPVGLRAALERDVLDRLEPLVRLRWLLLPDLAEQHARREARRIVLPARKLVRPEEPSARFEHPLDGVALRFRERRLEPRAADSRSVLAGRAKDRIPARAREIRVVEHQPCGAACQPVFERRREARERPAALVAIETLVSLPGKTRRHRRLACARDSGDEHHLRRAFSGGGGGRPGRAEARVQDRQRLVVERDARRRRRLARALRPARAGQRDYAGM